MIRLVLLFCVSSAYFFLSSYCLISCCVTSWFYIICIEIWKYNISLCGFSNQEREQDVEPIFQTQNQIYSIKWWLESKNEKKTQIVVSTEITVCFQSTITEINLNHVEVSSLIFIYMCVFFLFLVSYSFSHFPQYLYSKSS